MSRFEVVPMELEDANEFVRRLHRHADEVLVHRFSIGLTERPGRLCGVAIVANPVSKALQDGWTVEVRRNCTDGTKDACSALYGASCRVAFAMGYRKVITYTGVHESGSSLKASGFRIVGQVKGREWDTPSRPRVREKLPLFDKYRWQVDARVRLPEKEQA